MGKKDEYEDYDEFEDLEVFKDPDMEVEVEDEDDLIGDQAVSYEDDEPIVTTNSIFDDQDAEYLEDEQEIEDADFVGTYIGEDYKWIVEKPFNIYALLLSWMYFVYRKLYLIGIGGLALTWLVLKNAPLFAPIFIIISMLLSAVFFNPIYLFIVKAKVQSIINTYENDGDAVILDQCDKRGGVNTPVALLIFLIFLIAVAFIYIHIGTDKPKSKFWDDNVENEANCLLVGKQAYNSYIDENDMVMGNFEELACEVILGSTKSYDIYLKIKEDGSYRYIYYENEGKYLTKRGDTKYIEMLENKAKENKKANIKNVKDDEKVVVEEDKKDEDEEEEESEDNIADYLTDDDVKIYEVSKNISKKYTEINNSSNTEAQMELRNTLTQQRTHFIFSKDEVFKPAKK